MITSQNMSVIREIWAKMGSLLLSLQFLLYLLTIKGNLLSYKNTLSKNMTLHSKIILKRKMTQKCVQILKKSTAVDKVVTAENISRRYFFFNVFLIRYEIWQKVIKFKTDPPNG